MPLRATWYVIFITLFKLFAIELYSVLHFHLSILYYLIKIILSSYLRISPTPQPITSSTHAPKIYEEEKSMTNIHPSDDTNLAYLCDPKMRADVSARNEDPAVLTQKYADLINTAISKVPSDMTIGIHLCRGNYRSQWFASGGYEPVAETLFQKLNVSAYFLEYDDARSGDFAPLRFLPENKVVVLGLMSSKKRELDDKEEIIKRLNEAAKFCPKGMFTSSSLRARLL